MNNEQNNTPQKPTMSVQEVAKELGIGKDLAYAICDGVRFPVKQIGRRKVVIRKSFQDWLYDGNTFNVLHMGK